MDGKEAFLNTVKEANNREILKAWNEEKNQYQANLLKK